MEPKDGRMEVVKQLMMINWTDIEKEGIAAAFNIIDTLLLNAEKTDQKDKIYALIKAKWELETIEKAILLTELIREDKDGKAH